MGTEEHLFRHEAADGHNRLTGDVSLAPPVSWQMVGLFLGLIVLLALLFLSFAGYAQRVIATGRIEGDRGLLDVRVPREGRLLILHVAEGQNVRRGQSLARIEFVTMGAAGSLQAVRAAAVARQAQALAARAPVMVEAAAARVAAALAQDAAARHGVTELDAQIREQTDLIASAREDLDRAREVAKRGFISGRDLRLREETHAQRRRDLLALSQEREEQRARIAIVQADARRARADLAAAQLDIARDAGDLTSRAAADEAQRWVEIVAPADGVVSGLTAHPDEQIAAGRSLLSILPRGARLVARLAIPAAGAGAVRAGQDVAIAVDAFPRQTFGTLPAHIATVSAATVSSAGGEAFVARAILGRVALSAYGVSRPLRPGMTISASIVTQRQSLLHWLLDPLFAVAAR